MRRCSVLCAHISGPELLRHRQYAPEVTGVRAAGVDLDREAVLLKAAAHAPDVFAGRASLTISVAARLDTTYAEKRFGWADKTCRTLIYRRPSSEMGQSWLAGESYRGGF